MTVHYIPTEKKENNDHWGGEFVDHRMMMHGELIDYCYGVINVRSGNHDHTLYTD